MSTNNRTSLRFSTYSGAPSLHPSLAPTTATTSTDSHNLPYDNTMATARKSQTSKDATFDTEKATVVRSPSQTTNGLNDPRSAEIKSWSATFDRMQDKRLDKQRYVMSVKKDDEILTNALGAKLERALGRRMVGQDAVFTRRSNNLQEKHSTEVTA